MTAQTPERGAHGDALVDPYDGLNAYGIAITALERILDLDLDLDPGRLADARAIASEAHQLAIAEAKTRGTTSSSRIRNGVIVTITPEGLLHGIEVDGVDVGRRVRTGAAILTTKGDEMPFLQFAMEADQIIVKPREPK